MFSKGCDSLDRRHTTFFFGKFVCIQMNLEWVKGTLHVLEHDGGDTQTLQTNSACTVCESDCSSTLIAPLFA